MPVCGLYVGTKVGTLVGKSVGFGVGELLIVVKVTTISLVVVAVAAELMLTE